MTKTSAAVALGFASAAHTYSHMFVLFFATVILVLERVWQMSYAELFALSIAGSPGDNLDHFWSFHPAQMVWFVF